MQKNKKNKNKKKKKEWKTNNYAVITMTFRMGSEQKWTKQSCIL